MTTNPRRSLRRDEIGRRASMLRAAGHTDYATEQLTPRKWRASCSCGHTTPAAGTEPAALDSLLNHLHREALRLSRDAATVATIRPRRRINRELTTR